MKSSAFDKIPRMWENLKMGKNLRFRDLVLTKIDLFVLFIQHENVSMVAGSSWWEWLQIWDDHLAAGYITVGDISTEIT